MRRILLSFIFLILVTSPAVAGWVRASLFGADVRAMVIDPDDPDVIYLGTSQGEIYVSRDGARTWENPRGGVPFPGYVVDNLTIDARGRLWAASWGLWGGGVVAVSEDGGITWSRRDAGLEEFSVRALINDPHHPDTIFVGGITGTYRSTDAGKTWTKFSEHVNVESLALDPRTCDRVYVGTWRQGWRSDDGGKNWTHINKGMVLDTDMFSINLDSRNPDNIWIATCGWVYNSVDRGDNWTRYRDGFSNRRIHAVEYDPEKPSTVYAGSVAGLYRTTDGGKSWHCVSDDNLVINTIGIHPKRPNRIILGTEGDGVYLSFDRGTTFHRSSEGLYNVKVAAVVGDPQVRNRLFAAVMFGGASSGIYRSTDGGMTWDRWNKTRLPEILSLVIHDNPNVRFLAGTEKGFFFSRDGVEWTQAAPVDQPLRVEEILLYNGFRLFAATSEGVFTSKDSGRTWYRLANAKERTLDIALGRWGEGRGLYALTTSGLSIFDGQGWRSVGGVPEGGHSIGVRSDGESDLIMIAGKERVSAGRVDANATWLPADAPNGALASVYQTTAATRNLFVNLPKQSKLLIASQGQKPWHSVPLPMHSKQVAAVAGDPFRAQRLYLGTVGQGLFIWDEPDQTPGRTAGYLTGGTN